MLKQCLITFALLSGVAAGMPNADGPWKLVTGEQSLVTRYRGGISRENLYTVYKLNTRTGEVLYLRSTYAGPRAISESWVKLSAPQPDSGQWDLICTEHSLLEGVTTGDIDDENLFCAFLIERESGQAWRLYTAYSRGKVDASWKALPAPPRIAGARWGLFTAEHSVARFSGFDLARQNIYSVFLYDETTGTVLRLNSWYERSSGTVKDEWSRP